MGRQRGFKRWGWSCFSWVGKSHLGFSAEEVQKHGDFYVSTPSPHPWRVLILTSVSRSSASFRSGAPKSLSLPLGSSFSPGACLLKGSFVNGSAWQKHLGASCWTRLSSSFLSTPRRFFWTQSPCAPSHSPGLRAFWLIDYFGIILFIIGKVYSLLRQRT